MELVNGKKLRGGELEVNGSGTLLLDYGKGKQEVYFIEGKSKVLVLQDATIRVNGRLNGKRTKPKRHRKEA